ncbi:hypothetical protein [Rhodopseudomonas palustris]|uniref:hypothetical protein n=1 Tax=Rhodopseudomonas palustris TaxID=1076 RepID=UPI00064190C7|nr:hypothetical protein [Rhodopseudomonas palustris]
MQHNDALTVIRNQIVESSINPTTSGQKAVDIEYALERAGLAIIPKDLVVLLGLIISRLGIDSYTLLCYLRDHGFAEQVPFDPSLNTSANDDAMPGDLYLKYGPAITAIMSQARAHLAGVLQ